MTTELREEHPGRWAPKGHHPPEYDAGYRAGYQAGRRDGGDTPDVAARVRAAEALAEAADHRHAHALERLREARRELKALRGTEPCPQCRGSGRRLEAWKER